MYIIGVPAKKWISFDDISFFRPLVKKDILRYFEAKDNTPLHDSCGKEIMVEAKVEYFTFQGKNYLRYVKEYATVATQLGITVEPTNLWDYLKTKGLIVGSNLQFNGEIAYNDVLGVKLELDPENYRNELSLVIVQEWFGIAKRLLEEVGVNGDLKLYNDLKWAAD